MKHKILVLILALTVASWAQTTTQTAPADPPQNAAPAEKASARRCDKMASADGKYSHANCMRHDEDETSAKDMSSLLRRQGREVLHERRQDRSIVLQRHLRERQDCVDGLRQRLREQM